jgi:hypothetical protein
LPLRVPVIGQSRQSDDTRHPDDLAGMPELVRRVVPLREGLGIGPTRAAFLDALLAVGVDTGEHGADRGQPASV